MKKFASALLLALGSVACAAPFSVPNSFSAGTQIKAALINQNFTAIQTELSRLATNAFIHTATSSTTHISCIDNPLTNDNPNAIVVFSHRWTGTDNTYYPEPFGIYYTSNKWCIFSETTSQLIKSGTQFNVVVYKP